MRAGRLRNNIPAAQYMNDLALVLSLAVLPITPEITMLSQQNFFLHKDPADRLIAATAIYHKAPLISADEKLQTVEPWTVIRRPFFQIGNTVDLAYNFPAPISTPEKGILQMEYPLRQGGLFFVWDQIIGFMAPM